MENSYREGFMNKIIDQGFTHPSIRWVATEKIHGANSGLWTDGVDVRISKKSCFIKNTEGFFNSDWILDRYKDDAITIYDSLKIVFHDIKTIGIYGEICGGSYLHKDVEPIKRAKKVQKGIYYTPDNDFLVFDIMATMNNGKDVYMPWFVVKAIEAYCKLKTVPELAQGTFDELIKYPNDGQSVAHKIFGLPTIEDNIMEGVVLKPIEPLFLADGSRVIVKNKNEKWAEKGKAPKRERKEINENIKPLVEKISQYVNENRLRNVLSHIGEVTNRDFGLINKELLTDVMDDYIKENGNEEFNVLDKKDRKEISKQVGRETAMLIRSNFLNIIDGEF